jgi:hypothetical protein
VFRDGSEVVITLRDADDLLRPTLAALSLSLNLRAAGAFAAQPGLRGATAAKIGYNIYVLANTAGVQYVGCTRTGMAAASVWGTCAAKYQKTAATVTNC